MPKPVLESGDIREEIGCRHLMFDHVPREEVRHMVGRGLHKREEDADPNA